MTERAESQQDLHSTPANYKDALSEDRYHSRHIRGRNNPPGPDY